MAARAALEHAAPRGLLTNARSPSPGLLTSTSRNHAAPHSTKSEIFAFDAVTVARINEVLVSIGHACAPRAGARTPARRLAFPCALGLAGGGVLPNGLVVPLTLHGSRASRGRPTRPRVPVFASCLGRTTLCPLHRGAHRERILEGELYAATARIDWRTLLKRTFDTDLRVCVRCGGRLVIRAVVTESASVAKLLDALRRPRAPPAAA
jgi:hypothetical protein